jgi:hypothetical protein
MDLFKCFEEDEKLNNLFQYIARTKIKDKVCEEDFIYNKQYVFKSMFDDELCNKIVEECFDINEWVSDTSSIHYQYKYIDIEKLSTDTFKKILIIINNKIPEISDLYELEKVKLEITEIVIIKNDENNEYVSRLSKDVDFLKFSILLNSQDEFEGGNIQFYIYNPTVVDISNNSLSVSTDDRMNKNINLQKGDMCIHGSLFYKNHNVTKGSMYLLVGYIKPVSVLEVVF